MSFYDSQNTDPWAAFESSTPAYSSQPAFEPPASQAFQGSSFGNAPAYSSQPNYESPAFQAAPAYSSQPNYESPASPAFHSAPVIQLRVQNPWSGF